MLTVTDEIDLVWTAPFNMGQLLFFLSRYLVWPEMIVATVGASTFPDTEC